MSCLCAASIKCISITEAGSVMMGASKSIQQRLSAEASNVLYNQPVLLVYVYDAAVVTMTCSPYSFGLTATVMVAAHSSALRELVCCDASLVSQLPGKSPPMGTEQCICCTELGALTAQ